MHFKNILASLTLLSACAVAHAKPFVHPGALHTNQDIQRIKKYVKAEAQPWSRAWQHLESTTLAQTTWVPKPQEILVRGTNATWQPTPAQNYGDAYRDAHSAYQLTLRWLIGGNTSYADHAVQILNGWGSTLRDINGTEDKFLAAGLYGYQFANAAELLRVYPGWTKADQTVFGTMLNDVFAKYNLDFLEHHNYKTNFYYANWDLCNIASLQAIGIFNDNQTMYEYAVHYWQYGLPDSSVVVNGALPYFSIANFTEDSGKQLMEIQESGRDQGHATLCIALLGVIGQQGWNQGVDLFSTYQHEILHAAEYVAKYNTNNTVPYTPYTSWEGLLSVVASKQRFSVRPGYEAVASHYAGVKHMNASWSMEYRDYVNQNISADVEGGGGDYGPNSGGYDAFGHGTLLYRIKSEA
ncbi:exopolysaccharide inner membrane protein-like protein [Penicillium freii]|uniref:Alginate lyase domain-containing protein n=1 Tax=Penicillium freii TaxID=48697 RepID=A0A101MED7_PENFR|nr:exopolysaccharide inner membrane protein-like protein [Penicillium freii]KUM59057.1 hypothetical protein ACN42_g8074 [Penicillium freii]